MKRRLLLSCVSCLLALGLVTACNTEEEVDLNGDDGTTQNDGGGSGGDTQGGGSGDTSGSSDDTGDENTDGGYTAGEGETGVTLTNLTVHFYFKTGETYHTLPTFTDSENTNQTSDTDAYVAGYFNGYENGWVDYALGSTGKLTAGTDESSNPYYSYTFTSVAEGCDFNIYLEHDNATEQTWGHTVLDKNAVLLFEETPADGATIDYIIEADPAERISSPYVYCKVTIGVYVTDYASSTTLYIDGNLPTWGASGAGTQMQTSSDATTDGYHYYHTATLEQSTTIQFYVGTSDYPWNARLILGSDLGYWDDDTKEGWYNYSTNTGIEITSGFTECEEFTFVIATSSSSISSISSSNPGSIDGGCAAYMDGTLVAATGCYASTGEDE